MCSGVQRAARRSPSARATLMADSLSLTQKWLRMSSGAEPLGV
jgi:hypothetical protein